MSIQAGTSVGGGQNGFGVFTHVQLYISKMTVRLMALMVHKAEDRYGRLPWRKRVRRVEQHCKLMIEGLKEKEYGQVHEACKHTSLATCSPGTVVAYN